MTWQVCSCGHHRGHHPWLGHGQFGTTTGYGGCGHCLLCDKPSGEHVFVTHQFTRCDCIEYQGLA